MRPGTKRPGTVRRGTGGVCFSRSHKIDALRVINAESLVAAGEVSAGSAQPVDHDREAPVGVDGVGAFAGDRRRERSGVPVAGVGEVAGAVPMIHVDAHPFALIARAGVVDEGLRRNRPAIEIRCGEGRRGAPRAGAYPRGVNGRGTADGDAGVKNDQAGGEVLDAFGSGRGAAVGVEDELRKD